MANRKERPRRRAYLDDFQKDASGQYVYTGKRYAFSGSAKERRVYLAKILVFGILLLLASAVPEFLPPTQISKTPVTVVPWALQMVSVLLVCWSLIRLVSHAAQLREYVYHATVQTLPGKGFAACVLSAITLACQIGYALAKSVPFEGFTLARLIGSAISAVAALLFFLAARAGKWEEIL